MIKWLISQAESAMSRERRRPVLGPVQNAVIGVTLGVVVPVALTVKENRRLSPDPRPISSIVRDDPDLLALAGGVGLVSSQPRLRGLILAIVGSAALLAPLGGSEPDPASGDDWHEMAAFGAIVGAIVWAAIRLMSLPVYLLRGRK